MKKRLSAIATAASTTLALSGCTSLYVRSDVNRALIETVHCHTFAWAGAFKGDGPLRSTIANPVNESRLRAAIAAQLQSAGVQPVTAEAECLVGYGIGSRSVIEGAYPYGWGWGWPWWDGPYVYEEGIIGVDLYDAKSHQPLWHASVNQSLSGLSGAAAEERIEKAVAAIFTKYPGDRPAKQTT